MTASLRMSARIAVPETAVKHMKATLDDFDTATFHTGSASSRQSNEASPRPASNIQKVTGSTNLN
jgi:hypothetical protein